MAEGARIELQKFYVGRTTLFGLYYGVVLGVIFGIFAFIVLTVVTFPDGFVSFMEENIGLRFNIVLSSAVFLLFVVSGLIAGSLGSWLYNIAASMHGKMQFYLMEIDEEPKFEMGSV
ncbi:MAG: hypothetical protein AABX11_03930 [Nanoarchaeota archaeon]